MARANDEFLARWHRLVEARDLVALEQILADDVSMGAPPYWDKLKGRPLVHHLLGLIAECPARENSPNVALLGLHAGTFFYNLGT